MITQTKVCFIIIFFCNELIYCYILGFGQWPITGNQSTDEVFMSAQEAVGAHRDTQGKTQF